MAPPSPAPAFYLSVRLHITLLTLTSPQVGRHITFLTFTPRHLLVATADGALSLYCLAGLQLVTCLPAFPEGGVLWAAVRGAGAGARLVAQSRFHGLKVYRALDAGWGEWEEVVLHCIPHQGFCKGLLVGEGEQEVVVCPSGQSKVMVARLVGEVIRVVGSLAREKAGTVMAVAAAGEGRLVVGWESGLLVLWEWREGRVVAEVDVHSRVGTIMSLAWDTAKGVGAVVGSEARVVVVDGLLEVVGEVAVTNPGLGAVAVRGDSALLATGGWDARLRLFSWRRPSRPRPLAVLQFHQVRDWCWSW